MDNWGKIAAIVALTTIPIYASPLILLPTFRKLRDFSSQIYYRNNRCEAIEWTSLDAGPTLPSAPRQTYSQAIQTNDTQHANESSQIEVLTEFLRYIWQAKPKAVARPPYLDISKAYIRLDTDVLLAVSLLDGSTGSPDQYPGSTTSCTLNLGSAAARFRTFENAGISYIIGTLYSLPRFVTLKPGFHGLTKDDLRAVASGYPPFYRRILKANSGCNLPHPVQSMRDIHRGGWVVAIGFASADEPLNVYVRTRAAAYSDACDRVLETLQRLQREYASEEAHTALLDKAVRAVKRMNGYRSGSGVNGITKGTVLLNGNSESIGGRLNVSQLLFALKFFNDYRDDSLSVEEREMFEPMLTEVLRAAVFGVLTWWQYVNNIGHYIPGWLLDERVRMSPIWMEGGSGRE